MTTNDDAALDRVSQRTLRDCMQTVFEDGPKRDRRLWLGDLRLQALANYATTSVLGRASERGVWELHLHDVRDVTDDPHRTVDDTPYGGGAGMVLSPEPLARTLEQTPGLARPAGAAR